MGRLVGGGGRWIQYESSLLDTDTVPRPAAKGHVEPGDVVEVRVTFEPALWLEFEWGSEDGRVVEDVAEGHGDGVAGGNGVGAVLEGLCGGHEWEAGGKEGA